MQYGIVGDPIGLAVRDGTLADAIPAAAMTRFPPIDVYTIDPSGHFVLHYDTGTYNLTATLAPTGPSGQRVALHNATVLMHKGKGTLRHMATPRPRTGRYVLLLMTPGLGNVSVRVYIAAGPAAALFVVRQPSPVTDNVNRLAEQPLLGLRDSAGNDVSGVALAGRLLLAKVVPPPAAQQRRDDFMAPLLPDGRFHFSDVGFAARYGQQYRLNFSLTLADMTLPPLQVCTHWGHRHAPPPFTPRHAYCTKGAGGGGTQRTGRARTVLAVAELDGREFHNVTLGIEQRMAAEANIGSQEVQRA